MLIRVTEPTTDTDDIVSVAEALAEFREQDPSAEPDAWQRRIYAAERAFEAETGMKLRPQTIRAEGRSLAARVVWLPVGPLITLNSLSLNGTDVDLTNLSIVSANTIAANSDYVGCDFRGWLVLEAVVGFGSAELIASEPEIRQALFQLIGHWSENREAAQSQSSVLGGSVLEVPWSWRASLERWRLMVC